MKILLVLPDPAISGFLEAGLLDAGYQVRVARHASQVTAQVRTNGCALVIVDALGSGLIRHVSTTLEGTGSTARMLALVAPDEAESDDVVAYADDCLTKPFKFDALLARIRELSVREPASPAYTKSAERFAPQGDRNILLEFDVRAYGSIELVGGVNRGGYVVGTQRVEQAAQPPGEDLVILGERPAKR